MDFWIKYKVCFAIFAQYCKQYNLEMETIDQIRADFPALQRKVYGKQLIYFDNAATSQKPLSVLTMQEMMSGEVNANIHRAVHKLSAEATDFYEKGREAVRSFINAPSRENIIFTSGATASLNLVASSFVYKHLGKGDKVLISEAEHHSNIVSWQLACERVGASLAVLPVDDRGEISLDKLEQMLNKNVKIVAITHISNVLGVINPIKEVVTIAHAKGIPVVVDGAQGVVHCAVDVQDLDCDCYAFSGHKIYAPTGTGILYGKKNFLEDLPPYMGGGDMVDTVTFEKTTYAELPLKFEAGTPNFAAAACYAPALEYAAQLRLNTEVQENERKQVAYLKRELDMIDGVRIYGMPEDLNKKIPLFSITVEGVHPTDLAQLLDTMGIAVRSGLMCAEPLIRKYSDNGMLRASLAPYNTMEEAEKFITGVKKGISILK